MASSSSSAEGRVEGVSLPMKPPNHPRSHSNTNSSRRGPSHSHHARGGNIPDDMASLNSSETHSDLDNLEFDRKVNEVIRSIQSGGTDSGSGALTPGGSSRDGKKKKKRRSIQSHPGSVRSAASRTSSHAGSHANSVASSGTAPKSILRTTKYERGGARSSSQQRRNAEEGGGDADARSVNSAGSHASRSSVISASYKKIKGYLKPKQSKSRRQGSKRGSRSSRGDSSARDHRMEQENSPHLSGRKAPKYRSTDPNSGPNSSTSSTGKNNATPSTRRVRLPDDDAEEKIRKHYNSPRSVSSYQSKEMAILEESGVYSICESSEMDPPSEHPSACSSRNNSVNNRSIDPSHISIPNNYSNACISVVTNDSSSTVRGNSSTIGSSTMPYSKAKVATKGPAKDIAIDSDSGSAQVIDLPWLDSVSHGKLRGLYTGPVLIIPHGEGKLTIEGNSVLKFSGRWENGELVTPLITKEVDEASTIPDNSDTTNTAPNNTSTSEESNKKSTNNDKDTAGYESPDVIPAEEEPANNMTYDDLLTKVSKERSESKKKPRPKEYHKKPSTSSVPASTVSEDVKSNYAVDVDYSKLMSIYLNHAVEQHKNDKSKNPNPSSSNNNDGDDGDDDGGNQSNSRPSSPTKPKYRLGEIARSPRDMIIHRSNSEAIHSASLLQKHEHAFLKRSNGAWTCALLADKTFQPKNAPSTRAHWHTEDELTAGEMPELEECMLFVINEDGATKIIKQRHWGKFVRRSRKDDDDDDDNDDDK